MPSLLHELLVDLFRRRAQLAAELAPLLPYGPVDEWRADDSRVALKTELSADLVLVGYAGLRPASALVIEVQLAQRAAKRLSWPVYLAAVRARYACPTALVVVTPFPSVARWARAPIELDGAGSRILAQVVGPDRIPRPSAASAPELALLGALAHQEPLEVLVALDALGSLDSARAAHYADLLLATVAATVVAEVKRMLDSKQYVPKTPWLKEQYERGVAEGRAAGAAEGRAAALAVALLRICEARGLLIDEPARARISGTREPERLERWIDRAAVAERLDEVFEADG